MKWLILLGVVFFVGMASAEMRDFSTQGGETVRAELLDYNLKTDKVTLKADTGKTVLLKADSLADKDFMYVRDWDAVRLFSKNTKFRIYLNEVESKNKWTKYSWRRNPGKVQPSHILTTYFNRLSYEIKFDNQTGYDLENVEIKYCIYYEQERLDHRIEEKVADLVVRPSLHTYAIIPDGQNKKFESNSIVLRRKDILGGTRMYYLEGEGRMLKSKTIGIIFRATIQTGSGLSMVREMRLPKDLSEEYVWVEPTPENTVWADDDLDGRTDIATPPTAWEEMGGKADEENDE